MSLKCGIVGLPNVGKATLFNGVSSSRAQSAKFPFCTIEPNLGSTAVPDKRLDVLSEICKPQRTIPATVDIVDIAGLVRGASRGEGLGNQFLANIRETDAILHINDPDKMGVFKITNKDMQRLMVVLTNSSGAKNTIYYNLNGLTCATS